VLNVDVTSVCRQAEVAYDVVTSRSFAGVASTVGFIDRLLGPGGLALVSEPPSDRSATWAAALADHPRLRDDGVHQGVRVLRRC